MVFRKKLIVFPPFPFPSPPDELNPLPDHAAARLVKNQRENAWGARLVQKTSKTSTLDILIRKISPDPIGLHGQGAIANYIQKFQVATMSLEVA